MGSDGTNALRAVLGGDPPPGLVSSLQDDELAELAATIQNARIRQSRALAAAGDKALGSLPAIVRGPVKRVVGA
jgi:hypothetical protein